MTLESLRAAARSWGAEWVEGAEIRTLLTLRIGGRALFLLRPGSWTAAASLLEVLEGEGLPYRVLGAGSNVLASDGDLPFGVVLLRRLGGSVRWSGEEAEADADVLLPALAAESVRRGLRGMEGMGGIPGTVGGAVIMNAGAFGCEMAPLIREVGLLEPGKGLVWHPASDFSFTYRRTDVAKRGIVAACRLRFEVGDKKDLQSAFDRNQALRAERQPKGVLTSGSVFMNPPGDFAGRILDELGFRGRRRGDAGFADKHANWLVNHGAARYEDAWGLCEEARRAALHAGYALEYEVEVWT
ncbi:MAG: UDP-N-acetylmuramate dehydrogenase [Acidobacteriota bacterium]